MDDSTSLIVRGSRAADVLKVRASARLKLALYQVRHAGSFIACARAWGVQGGWDFLSHATACAARVPCPGWGPFCENHVWSAHIWTPVMACMNVAGSGGGLRRRDLVRASNDFSAAAHPCGVQVHAEQFQGDSSNVARTNAWSPTTAARDVQTLTPE